MAFDFDDDKKMEQLTAFLEKARKDGVVSEYEIDELMTECDLDISNKDTLLETLEASGVEITGTEIPDDYALMDMEEEAHEQAVEELAAQVARKGLGEMVVTPREVDEMVGKVAVIIADGINLALQSGLSEEEIRTLSHDGP